MIYASSQKHPLCGVADARNRSGKAANLALASLPKFYYQDISATERYYAEDITQQYFILNPDSTITVPNSPGLGVEIEREAMKQVTLASLTIP
jgi:O-succinylbenzoate synthase